MSTAVGPGPSALALPAVGSRRLADLVPAVAAALGHDAFEPVGWELPPARSYVVFLVDGLGLYQLERHRHLAPFLAEHLWDPTAQPLHAMVPSTTATSLTSLGTALPPGGHGVVGYTVRDPGSGSLFSQLAWDLPIEPETWQPHPTAWQRLASAGARVRVVNDPTFAGSGLTRAGFRGAGFVAASTADERLEAVLAAAAEPGSVTYCYDAGLDHAGHGHGVDSPAWREQLVRIDGEIERLRDRLGVSTRMVVTGDHGMIDSPETARVDLRRVPELVEDVQVVAGEARFRHLYCRPGRAERLAATWREWLGERGWVATRAEAVAAGWFGAVEDRVAPRLGEVMVAAGGDLTLLDSQTFPHEHTMRGFHGSATPEELTVPCLVT